MHQRDRLFVAIDSESIVGRDYGQERTGTVDGWIVANMPDNMDTARPDTAMIFWPLATFGPDCQVSLVGEDGKETADPPSEPPRDGSVRDWTMVRGKLKAVGRGSMRLNGRTPSRALMSRGSCDISLRAAMRGNCARGHAILCTGEQWGQGGKKKGGGYRQAPHDQEGRLGMRLEAGALRS